MQHPHFPLLVRIVRFASVGCLLLGGFFVFTVQTARAETAFTDSFGSADSFEVSGWLQASAFGGIGWIGTADPLRVVFFFQNPCL